MSNNGLPWPPITGGAHRGHFLRGGVIMTISRSDRVADQQNVGTQHDSQASDRESVGQIGTQSQIDSRFLEVFRTRWKLNEAGYRFLADR
jgi:hypothetical protein